MNGLVSLMTILRFAEMIRPNIVVRILVMLAVVMHRYIQQE
jgi:hypothetical protein